MRPGRAAHTGLLLGFGVLALAGCPQLLGIDSAVVVEHEGGALACGLDLAPGACRACAQSNCCAQMAACGEVPECARLETCLLGCGADYACRSRCREGQPSSDYPQVPPLDVCVVGACEAACGVSCGVVTAPIEPDAAPGCEACIAASGCSAAESCGRNAECGEVAQCYTSCLTLDCKEACTIDREAGTTLLRGFLLPLQGACATPCQYGENWDCLGHVTVPGAKADQAVVTVAVTTFTGAVVPGLSVKACSPDDLTCIEPLYTTTTDDGGIATLTVRGLPLGGGFSGYFDIEPPASGDGGAPAIVPFLDFLSYPLSEAAISFAATALSPADLAALRATGGVSATDAGATGDLVLVVFDCQLELSSGVSLQASSLGTNLTSRIRYVSGSGLDPSATATSSSGIAFLFGAPALQDIAVTGTPQAVQKAEGTFHAFTRAGMVSLVPVVPK